MVRVCAVAGPQDLLGDALTFETPLGEARQKAGPFWEVNPSQTAGRLSDAPLRFRVSPAPEPGDVLALHFDLKSLDPAGAQAMVVACLGGSGDGGALRAQAVAADDWTAQARTWQVPTRMPQENLTLGFAPYGSASPFAVRNVRLVNHGPDADPHSIIPVAGVSYPGQEADAPWRAEAAARIEKHRKAELRIRVVDAAGNPVPGAEVKIEQQRHAYAFGTAFVAARIVDQDISPYVKNPEFDLEAWKADNVRYRQVLEELFNAAVPENDLKWPQWVRDPGFERQDRQATLDALRILHERGIEVRGHTMFWPHANNLPEAVKPIVDDPEKLDAAVRAHVREIGEATAPWVREWDFLNEPVHRKIWKESFPADMVADWMRLAHEATGGARLFVNEFNIVGDGAVRTSTPRDYHKIIQALLDEGAPLHGIGFQGHFWSEIVTPPERVWEVIDDFARYKLPLRVTEYDFTCADDAYHAQYTRDFLTAWFAHPATDGFIMWGFWARAHWRPEAAMFRADWSPRPAVDVWKDLVFNQWWTNETLATDAEGNAAFRAFHGLHKITVNTADGRWVTKEVELSPTGWSGEVQIE